jgi:hypothetical protein
MHTKVVNAITALEAKAQKHDEAIASLDRRVSVIRTDVMKVIADLQAALVKAGEQLGAAARQLELADAAVKALTKRRRR